MTARPEIGFGGDGLSEDIVYPDNTAEAKEKALAAGIEVIVSDDYQLQLDLDTPADLQRWVKLEPWVRKQLSVHCIERWLSKSGNTHVLIRLSYPMPPVERVAWQAGLGSDRKRELLSLRDIKVGNEFPCMLFRPKDAVVSIDGVSR
jgi:hypothetical protein